MTLIIVSMILLYDITVPFRPGLLISDRREGPYCEVAAMGQCFRSGHPLCSSLGVLITTKKQHDREPALLI